MKVLFYGSVLDYTNGEKEFEFPDNNNCSSVNDLIKILGDHYERLGEILPEGNTCFFLVNGRGLMMTGGLNTRLNQGDKIEVLPFTEAG